MSADKGLGRRESTGVRLPWPVFRKNVMHLKTIANPHASHFLSNFFVTEGLAR
jgi:hypothetical protein